MIWNLFGIAHGGGLMMIITQILGNHTAAVFLKINIFWKFLVLTVYTFGFSAWQLWNISAVNSRGTPLGLEFSSEYISDALPVISFAFQEPENDPRNFTYVWAIRGENDLDSREEKDCLKNNATITLYALAFQNRDDCDAGVLYTGLTACHQRYVECP